MRAREWRNAFNSEFISHSALEKNDNRDTGFVNNWGDCFGLALTVEINQVYCCMTQPKHLSDESWAIISRPENKFQQFRLGFGETGETTQFGEATLKFIGNFPRKKDADALKSDSRKVFPYLCGKLKTGWAVIERV